MPGRLPRPGPRRPRRAVRRIYNYISLRGLFSNANIWSCEMKYTKPQRASAADHVRTSYLPCPFQSTIHPFIRLRQRMLVCSPFPPIAPCAPRDELQVKCTPKCSGTAPQPNRCALLTHPFSRNTSPQAHPACLEPRPRIPSPMHPVRLALRSRGRPPRCPNVSSAP